MARVGIFIVWSVLCMTMLVASLAQQIFDVTKYGAVGDGLTDDTKALSEAWEEVCQTTSGNPTLNVPPQKVFLLNPISFQGPCKTSGVHFQILGKIIAPEKVWDGEAQDDWLLFEDVDGLTLSGTGTIDGRGAAWWKSCLEMKDCIRPTALKIQNAKNLSLYGLTHVDSQKNHISIHRCSNASIRNLHIQAPETSPNTDGIDISESTNIAIYNLTIGTGDDCVAINNGSFFINITDVKCGPGHGISIGSLGENGEFNAVENIFVKNCNFSGTTNGARIKTWKGGSGYARNIQFEDITIVDTENPIIIDQSYCPNQECSTHVKNSAVSINEVTYNNIIGTSKSPNAITLNCSSLHPCTGIIINSVNISTASKGKKVYSICNNAQGEYENTSPPVKCGNSTIVL